MLDVPFWPRLQMIPVFEAYRRGIFKGAFSHVMHVAAIERGKVPILDAPSQVLITMYGDESLGPRYLHVEVIVMRDYLKLVQNSPA